MLSCDHGAEPSRRELQDMLFVRRKAEIELIPQRPPATASSFEKQIDDSHDSQPSPLDGPRSSSSALLHYLVVKIRKAVNRAREKHASPA